MQPSQLRLLNASGWIYLANFPLLLAHFPTAVHHGLQGLMPRPDMLLIRVVTMT